jgi:hypothetical protein
MGNLKNALYQLRAERRVAMSHVEKLDKAISVIESLNGTGAVGKVNQPTGLASASASASPSAPKRFISKASRLKMAKAQRARWAKVRKEGRPRAGGAAKAGSASLKRTMSPAARRKIAAFQRARWAKLKAQQKKTD